MNDPARLAALELEVAKLSRQLQFVMAHLQLAYPAEPAPGLEAATALLEKGDKLGAIRAYGQQAGVGLAEAKAAVEALEQQLRKR